MGIYLGWVCLSFLAAAIAYSKGRSDLLFFAVSMVFSPAAGLLLVLLLPSRVEAKLAAAGVLTPCPVCQGLVKAEAIMCKHCRSELPGETVLYASPQVRVTNRGITVFDSRFRTHAARGWG